MAVPDFVLSYTISIHALVKRATSNKRIKHFTTKDFNPRPREEGDVTMSGVIVNGINFNPRPREEGDCKLYDGFVNVGYFNPRPREEGDLPPSFSRRICRHFNPRPREEGDVLRHFL